MQEVKIQELNITNVGAWVNYSANPLQGLEHKIKVISIFTNETIASIEEWDLSSLSEVYNVIVDKLSKLQTNIEPTGEVVINGIKFVFNKDLTKIKAGKIFDIKALGDELPNNYAYVLSIMYDCQEELNIKEKERLFIDYFPVQEFISFLGFFLLGYEMLSLLLLKIKKENLTIQQESFQQVLSSPTIFTKWLKGLTGMWRTFRICIIQLFYFGKNFSFRKTN